MTLTMTTPDEVQPAEHWAAPGQPQRRVLHFAQDGDTSGFFPQLARWHDRGRYRMYFATLNPMAPWLREYMLGQGVACFSCECRRHASYPLGLVRLARYLWRERIDILHTHLFEPSAIGLAAGVWARTPLRVMTRHYSDYHTRIHKNLHVRVDQWCNRRSQAIIAVSEHTAEHLIAVEQADRRKVHTVVNGIDFDRVRLSAPEAPARLRQELTPAGEHLLLIVARLHPEKGHEYLFQAVAELNRTLPRPVILAAAGTGPFAEAYRVKVQEMGCTDFVRFLGFRKDVADLMAAADVMVLPSVAEAFGLVLTEALYLGTPVVATHVGGIPEIVTDGVDGILVPPADSTALARALAGLLSDPERRRRLAGAGKEKVQRQFRFDTMVRRYEAVYEQLSGPVQGVVAHA